MNDCSKALQLEKGEIARQILNEYIENEGIKLNHIADQVEISYSMLSHFRYNQKVLSIKKVDKLLEYLNKNKR